MREGSVVLLAGVFALTGAWAGAQSLGDLAAREKERREKEGAKRGKVYTEYDLPRAGSGTLSQPGASETPAPAAAEAAPKAADAGGEQPKTEEELRAERAQDWRQRRQDAQAAADQLQKRAEQIQLALNDLTQNLYGGTRTAQLNQLDKTQKDLAAAKQKVADLDDEGRRNRYN